MNIIAVVQLKPIIIDGFEYPISTKTSLKIDRKTKKHKLLFKESLIFNKNTDYFSLLSNDELFKLQNDGFLKIKLS